MPVEPLRIDTPSSWLPRGERAHPKLAAALAESSRDASAPIVVRVTGPHTADIQAAVRHVMHHVTTVSLLGCLP